MNEPNYSSPSLHYSQGTVAISVLLQTTLQEAKVPPESSKQQMQLLKNPKHHIKTYLSCTGNDDIKKTVILRHCINNNQ